MGAAISGATGAAAASAPKRTDLNAEPKSVGDSGVKCETPPGGRRNRLGRQLPGKDSNLDKESQSLRAVRQPGHNHLAAAFRTHPQRYAIHDVPHVAL